MALACRYATYAPFERLMFNILLKAHLVLGSIPTDIAANIKRFTDLGVDVAITELDIRVRIFK
jgi:hypothetical protein